MTKKTKTLSNRTRYVLSPLRWCALVLTMVAVVWTLEAQVAAAQEAERLVQAVVAAPAATEESAPTPTPDPTATPEPVPEATPTATPEPTATPTEEPAPMPTPDPAAPPTPEPTAPPAEEPAPTPTPEPTSTPTPTPAPEPTATPTEEPAPTPTPEPAAEPTPTPTSTPGPTPTPEPTSTPELTPTPTPEPTHTPDPTPAPTPAPDPTPAPTEEPQEAEEPAEAPAARTPSFGSQTIAAQTWTLGQPIAAVTLPEATDGDGELTYTLSPALPAGVTLDAARRELRGTPTEAVDGAAYTWTAANADGDEATLTFRVTVAAPAPAQAQAEVVQPPRPQVAAALTLGPTWQPTGIHFSHQSDDGLVTHTFHQNSAITPVTLLAATGGVAPVSYQLTLNGDSLALVAGLSYDQSTRRLSGTPTRMRVYFPDPTDPDANTFGTYYTLKATDSTGAWTSIGVVIVITRDRTPTFPSGTPSYTFVQGWNGVTATLPAAGGVTQYDGALTYRIDSATPLPQGLSFSSATRKITGTPAAVSADTVYKLIVTDGDGDSARMDFRLSVVANTQPGFGAATVPDQTWVQNSQIAGLTLPAASGGNGALTYALTPALPTGVSRSGFDISGTPSQVSAATTYTWTATDADGDEVETTFTITVVEDLTPSFSDATASYTFHQNDQITPVTLPAATGGNGALTHSLVLDLGLAAGLSYDQAARTLSGRPTAMAPSSLSATPPGSLTRTVGYKLLATDADGDEAEMLVYIRITRDGQPTFAGPSPERIFRVGQQITAQALPAATGVSKYDGSVTYTMTRRGVTASAAPTSLPSEGIDFDAAKRTLTGTPTTQRERTTYTLTATDGDGDSASLTVYVTVLAADVSPSFGEGMADQVWWVGQRFTDSVRLPLASGGNGALTYTLSPALPSGVTRDARALFGTPTATMRETTYTWTVTDTDSDTDEITFTITVLGPGALILDGAVSNQTWTRNQAITSLTLPAGIGGNAPLTYTLTPALPAGVTRSGLTVSGTPSVVQALQSYTWSVQDSRGRSASIGFAITVVTDDSTPTFGSLTIDDQLWTQYASIPALTLPQATGGDGDLTYALTPALPSGVTRSGFSVSGTPAVGLAATGYTWTATDADGDEAQLDFQIAVDALPGFGQGIAAQAWAQGAAIAALTLPQASGGDGVLTYSVSPALPSGVTRSGFLVSGTPSDPQSMQRYSWIVSDADGDTAVAAFSISVDGRPTFGTTIANQSWQQDAAITALTLPQASGGDAPLTYTLSPALPDGVTRNGFAVSGTPSGAMATTTYTWKVTDADGDAAGLTFSIGVDGTPSFGSQTIDDQTWDQHAAITALTLPQATGGNGDLTYTLTPALPAGTARNGFGVSGTPTASQAATLYTWKVTDADGDSDQLGFRISVRARARVNNLPTFGAQTIDDQFWTQRQAITALTLPQASGGDGALTYTLTPTLPAGITRNVTTRELSGTPTVAMAATSYTWKVTDADGDEVELTFEITVDGVPTFGAQTIANQVWRQGQAGQELTLPSAFGGDAPLRYTLGPSLPGGVSRNEFAVSGTPTGAAAAATYTWKVIDADGDSAHLTFLVEVEATKTKAPEDRRPSFGGQQIDDQVWTQGQTVAALTLPQASGGDGSLRYTLDPALPGGVSRNGFAVSGAPTSTQAAEAYVWKAIDADGDAAQLTFDITVKPPDLQPSFGGQQIADQTWTQGQAIEALTLPQASGGNGPLSYALSPALPAGTARNGFAVSGAPTGTQAAAAYTWTVTDADGDTAQLSFSIAVAPPDLQPSFGGQQIADQTWTQGQAIDALTLPQASGGNGTLSYVLNPALPAGTARNGFGVSGAPTSTQAAAAYTWTVTDADGDSARLTFDITVTAAPPPQDPPPTDVQPSFGAIVADQQWTVGEPVASLTLPAATGGNGELIYALDPVLPVGVTRNGFVVSGTPREAQDAAAYTWTVTDADGDTAQLNFSITVTAAPPPTVLPAPDVQPSFDTDIADQQWTVGEAASLTLPAASGGNGELSYALGPALPDGTARNGFAVSGAPTSTQAAADYTWTVTDADGDTAQLSFSITVAAAPVAPPPVDPPTDDPPTDEDPPVRVPDLLPSFDADIADQQWLVGEPVASLTLPAASGGNGELTYTLGPGLPVGVTRDGFAVSGTPAEAQAALRYTWTATDEDGDTVSRTFLVTVTAPAQPPAPVPTDEGGEQPDATPTPTPTPTPPVEGAAGGAGGDGSGTNAGGAGQGGAGQGGAMWWTTAWTGGDGSGQGGGAGGGSDEYDGLIMAQALRGANTFVASAGPPPWFWLLLLLLIAIAVTIYKNRERLGLVRSSAHGGPPAAPPAAA